MVGSGWLNRQTACNSLLAAALSCGLDEQEARRTLQSGLEAGAKEPHKALEQNEEEAEIEDETEAGASDHTWMDPDWSLLDDRRGELPEFPIGVFAPQWRDLIERLAHGAGVTVGHVAVPMLSIASSLIGTARRIAPSRSWSEPLTLWTAVVGFSETGKTPGLDVTKRPLSQIEYLRRHKVDALRCAHQTRHEAARAASKKWKADVQAAVDNGQKAPPIPADAIEPDEFIAPRLYVSDATVERFAVLLQARPRGMSLVADELASLFLNMGRYSRGQDNEFWLEAFNGKHFVVERMGRPPVVVKHLLIGITGGFQPDKLSRSFNGDADGMYARVCFAWPAEPSYQRLSNDVAEDEPELINALSHLVDLPAGGDAEFAPRRVSLSADAVEGFEQFRQFAHASKDGLDGREREWWAKGGTHVLRLAGTLAYLDWVWFGGPEPSYVSKDNIDAAIRLWHDYFWPHTRAALRQVGRSERHHDARRALRWLRAHRKTEISREDVRRDALGQKLDAEQTEGLLATLAKAGWLRETASQSGPKGGKPARRWLVNPILIGAAETAETAETVCREAVAPSLRS